MQPSAADSATRRAYDAVAADYARLVPDMSLEAPLDRAVLAAFTEMVREQSNRLVVEVGCGPGRVTRHLADAGLAMVGLDVSLEMLKLASASRPELPVAVAHAGALPLRAGVVGGVVCWYSLINLPGEALPRVCQELARVTATDAPVVIGFQSGEGERVVRESSYGRRVPLTYYRHRTEAMTDALVAAGFTMHATVRREASLSFETTQQTQLLARRR
jgi:ubiquinone/menaquinone biosynthesis C-methylase UbiE